MAKLKMIRMPKQPKLPKAPKANASVEVKKAHLDKISKLKADWKKRCSLVAAENRKRESLNRQSVELSKKIAEARAAYHRVK